MPGKVVQGSQAPVPREAARSPNSLLLVVVAWYWFLVHRASCISQRSSPAGLQCGDQRAGREPEGSTGAAHKGAFPVWPGAVDGPEN